MDADHPLTGVLFACRSTVWTRPTPPAFLIGYARSSFPARPGAFTTAGGRRSPRFRRVPALRDVASDPGRATGPCIAAPHMLPSAVATASAPATSRISWLNPTPHKIAVYASPWSSPSTPQHSLPGGRYPLPGPDFHRLERASFAWRTATSFRASILLRSSRCSAVMPPACRTVPAIPRAEPSHSMVRRCGEASTTSPTARPPRCCTPSMSKPAWSWHTLRSTKSPMKFPPHSGCSANSRLPTAPSRSTPSTAKKN